MPTLRFRLLKWEAANAGIVTIKLLRAHLLRPVRKSSLCSNCVCKPESCFPPSRTWTAAWCGHLQWLICLVNHGETCIPSLWKLGRISNAPGGLVRPCMLFDHEQCLQNHAGPFGGMWRIHSNPSPASTDYCTAKLLAAKLPYGNQLTWEFVIYVGIQNMSVRNIYGNSHIPPNGFNRRKIIIHSKLWALFWRDIGIVFFQEGRYLSLTKPDSFATKQRSRMGELKAPSSLAFCASWAACCARCVASLTQSWRRPIGKQPTRNMFCPENYTLEN